MGLYQYAGYSNHSDSCEHCGTAIKHVFTVRDVEVGTRIKVGSECVRHFLSADDRQAAERDEQRYKRAATQWRKREPAPLPDESREDYINRRVIEMGNALSAFRAWMALFRGNNSIYQMAIRNLRERGIQNPADYSRQPHYRYPDSRVVNPGHDQGGMHECELCQQREALKTAYHKLCTDEQEAIIRRHEQQYNANRFDFRKSLRSVSRI